MTSDDPVAVRMAPAWSMLAVLVARGAILYLQVFVLPNVPPLRAGRSKCYLNHAARMVDGEWIYRDFDHFTLPGTDVLYTMLFRLLDVGVWISQATLVGVGLPIAWLVMFISKKLLSGFAAFLPACLFVTLSFSKLSGCYASLAQHSRRSRGR